MRKPLSLIVLATVLLAAPLMAGETKGKSKSVKAAKSAAAKTPRSKAVAKIDRDVNRLETILAGLTTNAQLSEKAWKSVSNEANSLANQIHAAVKSTSTERSALRAASSLRDRVQRLHKEAHNGDATDARRYAREALRYAYRLDEWAG